MTRARLNASVNESLKSEELRAAIRRIGFEAQPGSPADFTKLLTNEMKVSVRSTRMKTLLDGSYTCEIGILVNSTVRLDEVMKKLRKLKEVQSVTRAGSA